MRRRQDLRRSAVLRCQGQGRATVYREIEREHTHTAAGAADGYHAIAELRLIGNGGTPRRRTGGEPAGAGSCLPTQIGRVNPKLAPLFSGGFQPSSQHWPLMAGIVSALTDDGACQVGEGRAGVS